MRLSVNQLIRWNLVSDDATASRTERIIFIDESYTDIAAINVDEERAQPVWYKSEIVDVALQSGEAWLLEIDHCAPLILTADDLRKTHYKHIKEVRDQHWQVLEPLVTGDNEFKMLFPSERAALISERTRATFPHGRNGEETTYSRQSIYLYYYLWLRGGKTKNALFGRYLNSGARGKRRVQKERKLGRPSKHSNLTAQSTGVVLADSWMNIICFGAMLFFNNKKVNGIRAAYRKTLELFCPKGKLRNEKGEWEIALPDYTKGEVFSPRQFEYHIRKELDRNLQEFFRKKFGERRYKLRFRGLKGSSTREAPYPGALYQIDATIADAYLVNRLNRLHVIGRPTIVVIIDVFSRMIVGVCVRFEREGWNVVSLALKNSTEDKVQFCRKYGIEIGENDWPVIGLCDAITGDRGPMIGYNADNLVAGLHVSVSNLPPYRADWKGIIEQMFRLMNIRVITQLPGALNPKRERGDRDVRLDAVLDIEQFTAILIKAILYHNNRHYMEWYELDKDMIASGVRPIPRELFLWGRRNRSGTPRRRDSEAIRIHLLPGDDATVTARGIRFKRQFYTCQKAEEENWRFIARNKGIWKETIAYDPRVPEIIYLRPSDGSASIPCYLMDPESIADGSDWVEIEEYNERKHLDDQLAEVPKMEGRAELDAGVEDIVKDAEAMAAAAWTESPEQTNSSRFGDMNERKQAEIDLMNEEYRQEILGQGGSSDSVDTSTSGTVSGDHGETYVQRPRFSNALSIQERMMKQNGQED